MVDRHRGLRLRQLHDTAIGKPGDGHLLLWDASQGKWVAKQAGSAGLGDGSVTDAKLATPKVNRAGDTMTGDLTTPRLRVTALEDVSLSSTLHGLQIGPTSGANVALDQNEIMARNNGAASDLHLNADGGTVHTGADLRVGAWLNVPTLPASSAYKTASQSLAASTWTKITFPNESYDQTNNYNPSTSEFTVPSTGVYLIVAKVFWDAVGASNRYVGSIYLNGADSHRTHDMTHNNGPVSTPAVAVLSLTAGVTVALWMWSAAASSTTAASSAAWSTLTIRRLV